MPRTPSELRDTIQVLNDQQFFAGDEGVEQVLMIE
jgi:hypothetical protein